MNKTVLITGASGGIGLEFAKIFASKGDNVILVARSEDKLIRIRKYLEEKYHIFARFYAKDLTLPNAAKELFDEIVSDGCKVDYLINNAGFGDNRAFLHADWETHEKMVKLNVLALMELCYLFGRAMYNRGGGKILNVASVAAFSAGPYMSVYFASKAFVLSFSEALAEEFKNRGVSVTCLCPGPTESNFGNASDYGKSNAFRFMKLAKAEEVARTGYKAMMSGKTLSYHGINVKAMTFLTRIVPRSVSAKFTKFMNDTDASHKHKL
ncbi:MAG: SDR family oxidoreductase [Oscillospiraceae bacterium]|nr:SDR family oxidoreductase [Oscillospiraceae bacterium]